VHGLILYSWALAQVPRQGGLTWLHLHFPLGLRRLGWDVLFVDRLEPEMCVDEGGQPTHFEESLNLRYFLRVMEDFGLDGAFSLICSRPERVIGLSRARKVEKLFSEGRSGKKEAPWIGKARKYEFLLYAGKDHQTVLARVTVTKD
jgi:hypothetical protein